MLWEKCLVFRNDIKKPRFKIEAFFYEKLYYKYRIMEMRIQGCIL